MINLLPTETVILIRVDNSTVNEIGETVITETPFTVEDCLVQPGSASELPEGMELQQNNFVTVHIPSTFKEDLTAGYSVIRGKRYRIITETLPLTASPLIWDHSITCEAVK